MIDLRIEQLPKILNLTDGTYIPIAYKFNSKYSTKAISVQDFGTAIQNYITASGSQTLEQTLQFGNKTGLNTSIFIEETSRINFGQFDPEFIIASFYNTGSIMNLDMDFFTIKTLSGSDIFKVNTLTQIEFTYTPFTTNLSGIAWGQEAWFTKLGGEIAIGTQALMSTTSQGVRNIALGTLALKSLTSGTDNISIGSNSQVANLTANYNISIGSSSLLKNKSDNNIAIGYESLYNTINSSFNIGIGYRTLYNLNNANAQNNIAIGYNAGFSNNSNNTNIVIGNNAYVNSVSGISNIVLGHNSLTTSASNNIIVIGHNAVQQQINSTINRASIAIGDETMTTNSLPQSNIAIGYRAMFNNGNGSQSNIAIGVNALNTVTTTSVLNNIIAIGGGSGINSQGSRNIYIGGNSGANFNGIDNIIIGNQLTTPKTISKFIGFGANMDFSLLGNNNIAFGEDATGDGLANLLVFGSSTNPILEVITGTFTATHGAYVHINGQLYVMLLQSAGARA